MRLFSFLLFFSILLSPAIAKEKMDYKTIGQLPILNNGRLKPLDTFARIQLLSIYEKQSLKKKKAIQWLVELMTNPDEAYKEPVFRIRNPAVITFLNLKKNKKHLYTFNDVSKALGKNLSAVQELNSRKKEERTPEQNQVVELYMKALQYYEVSRSLTLVFEDIRINTAGLALKLGLEKSKDYTYLQFLPKYRTFQKIISKLEKKKTGKFNEEDRDILTIAHKLSQYAQDVKATSFRVIPALSGPDGVWFSPWAAINNGQGSPQSAKFTTLWGDFVRAHRTANTAGFEKTSSAILSLSHEMAGTKFDKSLIKLEQNYNTWDLFTKSLALYILAFLLVIFSSLTTKINLRRFSFGVLSLGLVLHTAGIIIRMIVMERPPVSTLYESIIFVGAVVVLGALILEHLRKNGVGLLTGTITGAVLHFIAIGYESDGDTMGMLVAVLNSNFWLATHVVAITIGYGFCLVVGLLAHIFLIKSIFQPNDREQLGELKKNMQAISLIALFFSLTGTVLGGIWADQSWGRFWGWDPKENGAMLIVMWILMVLHGRMAGILKDIGIAACYVGLNIIVALAWFGVNLLAIGLHSYGFTDSIALNLFLFCFGELLFIAVTVAILKLRKPLGTSSR